MISALRSYYVGTDTANYLFNNIEQGNFERYLSEPLSYLLFLYSPNHEMFIFLQSCIVLFPLFLIHKELEKPYLMVLLYYLLGFYFFSFNISRQMIAATFALLGLLYYMKKKWMPYIILMAIAFGFHNTSLVVLILPLCDRYLKLNKKLVYIILPITFIIGLVASVQVFSLFTPIIGDYIDYVSGEHTRGGTFSLNRLLLNVFFIIIYNYSSKEGKESLFMKSMFISIILYNLLTFSGVVNRIAMYFSIAEVVLLSQNKYIHPQNKRIFQFAVFFYAFAYFSLVLINNLGGVVPYEINPIYKSYKGYDLLLMCMGTILSFSLVSGILNKNKAYAQIASNKRNC